MKLDRLLQDVEHLGFVEAHDADGFRSNPDGFRVKTRRAWAAALREHKPGNRRALAAIKLAESETERLAALASRLDAAYAAGRLRAMQPGAGRTSRIPGRVNERKPVHRRFRSSDIRWGLTSAELDAIPTV